MRTMIEIMVDRLFQVDVSGFRYIGRNKFEKFVNFWTGEAHLPHMKTWPWVVKAAET